MMQTVNRLVLDNGITLLVVENPVADLVAGRIFLKNGGTRWETREQAGINHLLATVITKGTERLTAVEIADFVESTGASLGADAAADYFVISIKTVARDFAKILRLAGEIMRSPSFPDTEVELEQYLTLQNIRAQREQPFNTAYSLLREAMYPEHPYGVSILGTEATVPNLNPTVLKEYHQTYFRPDNLVISLSGRIKLEEAVTLVEEVFGDWQIPSTPLPSLAFSSISAQPCQVAEHQDSQQAIIMLGYLAATVFDPNYSALKLFSTYLGNGLSSRLFVEMREKRGLAYDVSAFYPTRLDPSQFVVYMGTAPENKDDAIAGLRSEVERLSEQTLSPQELQAAKNKLLGQYALGKQTNAEIAQIFGWYESLGLGIEFDTKFQEDITNVTPEAAQAVAKQYLTQPYLSLVGPKNP